MLRRAAEKQRRANQASESSMPNDSRNITRDDDQRRCCSVNACFALAVFSELEMRFHAAADAICLATWSWSVHGRTSRGGNKIQSGRGISRSQRMISASRLCCFNLSRGRTPLARSNLLAISILVVFNGPVQVNKWKNQIRHHPGRNRRGAATKGELRSTCTV